MFKFKQILLSTLLLTCFLVHAVSATNSKREQYINTHILGHHQLSLQWLDNNNRGSRGDIEFIRFGEQIVASGYQEEFLDDELNYMRIHGIVDVFNDTEFFIDGSIETRVNHINDGVAIFRDGRFHFKVNNGRAYWRMQNQRTHSVTDYIDIYLKTNN